MAHGLQLIKAGSWTLSNDKPGRTDKRYPHLFYRAGEVDAEIDRLKRTLDFQVRLSQHVEAFMLKELGL